jgi:hypothetical protein
MSGVEDELTERLFYERELPMVGSDDAELRRGLTAFEAGCYADVYEILRPLADAGSIKAQACLGSIVLAGLHRTSDPAVAETELTRQDQ